MRWVCVCVGVGGVGAEDGRSGSAEVSKAVIVGVVKESQVGGSRQAGRQTGRCLSVCLSLLQRQGGTGAATEIGWLAECVRAR